MQFFSKTVDKRSRNAMIAFLAGHARHSIGNGYQSSYAHNVKIQNLHLGDLKDKAYDFIQVAETWWDLQRTIEEFSKSMGYQYTIGFAGRSNGYLVLLESEKVPSGYKSHCRTCGQRNYKSIADVPMLSKIGNRCGACGAQGENGLVNYKSPHMTVNIFPYRGIDAERDHDAWSTTDLRDRVRTIEAFDHACDAIRDHFIFMLQSCDVVEETIMVPKTINRLDCSCNH